MPRISVVLCLAAALFACDRNMEPYVEGETPRQPDLAQIFPEGAERADAAGARGGLPIAPEERGGRGADPSAEAPPIRGTIRVADEHAERAGQGGVLFLIARTAAAGPPLAVQRVAAPKFPLDFALGPEHRMIKALPFAGEMRLTARLDFDGDAMSSEEGDLLGGADGVFAPGASGVELVLDERL